MSSCHRRYYEGYGRLGHRWIAGPIGQWSCLGYIARIVVAVGVRVGVHGFRSVGTTARAKD